MPQWERSSDFVRQMTLHLLYGVLPLYTALTDSETTLATVKAGVSDLHGTGITQVSWCDPRRPQPGRRDPRCAIME